MSDWGKLDKCCRCVRLDLATRLIGALGLLISLGLFICYLVTLEDLRDFLLNDLYGIPPCTIPPIDTLIDTSFEYSVLANLLLIIGCVSCTRWLLVPWLCVYVLNMILLGCVSLGMFLVPVPLVQESQGGAMFQALRLLGLLPLVIVGVIFYLWLIVRSRFKELGETEKSDEDQCCPMRLKTGVQIIAGILAILSVVILILFFAKLDDIISRQYFKMFEEEIPNKWLNLMGGTIVLSIFVNILLILGCSGKKWRRVLAMPWLIFYGCGVVSCLWTHLYYTSLCWREEKMIGLGCLAIGFIFLIIWSLVWMVAAQVTEKQKTIISRPNPLLFKRA